MDKLQAKPIAGFEPTPEDYADARSDEVAEFWQFLNGLSDGDLLPELIQNDIDAGATHTVFRFEPNRLVCEGNGTPVDDDGWLRLSYMRGAGDRVPAKRNRIGVKNHGLKTCFTIGDEIRIRSGGKFISQTLYKDGYNNRPRPGQMTGPENDVGAPHSGCRIEVPFRRLALTTPVGERFTRPATTKEKIEQLFRDACRSIPGRFIACVRPKLRPRYTIEVSHWELGSAVFEFRCGRSKRKGRLVFFTRRCRVSGDAGHFSAGLAEGVAQAHVSIPRNFGREIPEFFGSRTKSLLEVSWELSRNSRPMPVVGMYRYPITYPGTSMTAITGVGVHFSGPFVSDLERHGLGNMAEEFNTFLRQRCDELLVESLRVRLVPAYGASALGLLINPSSHDVDRLRLLVEQLVSTGNIPVTSERHAQRLTRSKRRLTCTLSRSRRPRSAQYEFVVPKVTWREGEISTLLFALRPTMERSLHPETPPEIIEILSDENTAGWEETFVTFDECDALDAFVDAENASFDWSDDESRRADFINPTRARLYLDVVLATLKHALHCRDWDEFRQGLCLPDASGIPIPYGSLLQAVSLPAGLPAIEMPPILHPKLADHMLFNRREWRLKRYRLRDLLDRDDWVDASQETRREFWHWLRKHHRKVPKDTYSRLARLPVWPGQRGNFRPLSDLCLPKSPVVTNILGDVIDRPHEDLVKRRIAKVGGSGVLSIRVQPSVDEVGRWLREQLSGLLVGPKLPPKRVAEFRELEQSLEALAKQPAIAKTLGQIKEAPPGLSKTGRLRSMRCLHRETGRTRRLRLLPDYLIDRSSRRLDRFWRPRDTPWLAALVRTIRDDPVNFNLLSARLSAFKNAVQKCPRWENILRDIPCIPWKGKLHRPAEIAFRGKRDYWGKWKKQIPVTGLSEAQQSLFECAGVTRGQPNAASSLSFFRWLWRQKEAVIKDHLPQVLRHFDDGRSVRQWWTLHRDVPCLPVWRGEHVQLVSYAYATRSNGLTYLLDFPELGKQILERDHAVHLVIAQHPQVQATITDRLKHFKIKSLRVVVGPPIRVNGYNDQGNPTDYPFDLRPLRSRAFGHRLRSGLDYWQVDASHLRLQWQNRLSQVNAVKLIDHVEALYKFHNQRYRLAERHGFDPNTGTLWLKRTDDDSDSLLFEALGSLLFEANAPRVVSLVLQRVIEGDFVAPTFTPEGESYSAEPEDDEAQDGGEEALEKSSDSDATDDLVDAPGGHRPFTPNPALNFPRPGPIRDDLANDGDVQEKSGAGQPTQESGGSMTDTSFLGDLITRGDGQAAQQPGGSPTRDRSALEQKHIAALKADHYAYHCQMCLAQRSPQDLAPAGSYVEHAEMRAILFEGHHTDKHASGGKDHAGNLLALCKLHHDNFGARISRQEIGDALRHRASKRTVSFGSVDCITTVGGYITKLRLETGDTVPCFFTKEHRRYWLDHSKP